MALQQYSKLYWFPNGALAANEPAQVFPENSNALAPLFADGLGTPLANPTSTNGAGLLTFWAEEGMYWVHMDTESFLVDVGLSEEQADLSTGTASGGELDIATPTSVTINALVGYVADVNALTSISPTLIKVDQPTQTVALDAGSLARSITWWLMDPAGTVIQQALAPSPAQRRGNLVLGVSLFDTGLGQLVEVQTLPVLLGQPANQFADLTDSMGPFSLTGNLVTPNGPNLGFNKSAGTLFSRSSSHFVSGTLTDNPNIASSPAQLPVTLRRILQTSTIPTPPPVGTIDPTQYDVGGVLTPVGGGPAASTIQRVWLFATNVGTAQVAVQYGQATYGSLLAAVNNVGNESFTPAPVTGVGALIGYIAVIRTATNLSDPTQATFVRAGKFSTP